MSLCVSVSLAKPSDSSEGWSCQIKTIHLAGEEDHQEATYKDR